MERTKRFVELQVPARNLYPFRVIAVKMGATVNDPKMAFAIRRYWQWRFDPRNKAIPGSGSIGSVSAEQKEFKRQMRRAFEAARAGKDPDEFIAEALKVPGKEPKNVMASLESRKLLSRQKLTEDQLKSLKKTVSEEVFEALELHDALLEAGRQSIAPGLRRRGRRR